MAEPIAVLLIAVLHFQRSAPAPPKHCVMGGQAEVDTGQRADTSSEEPAELKRLRRENAELCRRTRS
jgi:hypothetical protein